MAKSIMIQGTMSNVGKSLLTAALCRIFSQDGYSVAPFKSQNMALNSFITKDGLEMGRAQVMQAEAAGIEPDAVMNPILLKPTENSSSQVIVNGESIGNMRAAEYFRRKREFVPDIMSAYSKLDRKYDIIAIEGAGSPAELNLKKDDIVNMGMAKLAKAPVLLVGDIDRGGVFAQLLGTLSLLETEELAMVKGLIVNKFRGDKRLFDAGANILEERGNKPVVGVIPYVNCNIDDEDSLSNKLTYKVRKLIDIAVIRLPRISNFTDFDAFLQYEDVNIRYVEKAGELADPDMIIIPGTKNTAGDMKWLRETGLETAVKTAAMKNTPVFGICGGYQILGETISDPDNCEGGGEIRGMGLLDTKTIFAKEKTRARTNGKIMCRSGFFSFLNDAEFYGYEIHMGRTEVFENSFAKSDKGAYDGAYKGNIAGTYIHGIFDSKDVSGKVVKALYEEKGMKYGGTAVDRKVFKESQYNILADSVRQNIDMKLIYKILREGI